MAKTSHVRELDGLRGILAAWVAIAHVVCLTGNWEAAWAAPVGVQRAWFTFITAEVAVSVFIVLSGFAISALLDQDNMTPGRFMSNRLFRIYPVYLACLIAGIAASPLADVLLEAAPWRETRYYVAVAAIRDSELQSPALNVLAHLTLLNGLIPASLLSGAGSAFLPPAWSITLEWQYYICAFAVAAALRSAKGALLLVLVSIFGQLTVDFWSNRQPAFLPTQLPLFIIGIGSYRLHKQLIAQPPLRAYAPQAAVIIGGLGVVAGWQGLTLAIWALCFGAVHAPADGQLAGAFRLARAALLNPILQRLGKISYPIYLVHWPVVIATIAVVLTLMPNVSTWTALTLTSAVALPATLLLAYLLHATVEKPLITFGRSFGKHRGSSLAIRR